MTNPSWTNGKIKLITHVFHSVFIRDHTLSIKYGGGGVAWRDFVGLIKYFRHILMGHELFFKVFDGPQNIFLCSLVILFFKLRRLEHKISKLAIKEI